MHMDVQGCKQLIGHRVIAHTTIGKEFVGTLQLIPNSAVTIHLEPLPPDLASNFLFAINGVAAIDVGTIAFMQDIDQPH